MRLDSHAGILEELAGVGYWPHAICVSCRFMEREGGASHNDLTFSSCTSSSPEARVPGTGLFPLTHSCHLPLVTPSHPLLSSQFAHLKTGSQNELIYRTEALPLVLT